MITALPGEHGNVALCCLMDRENREIASMYFAHALPIQTKTSVAAGSDWFLRAIRLKTLRDFCRVAEQVIKERRTEETLDASSN